MGNDLSASYLLTTTVKYYGESHILGFKFCPPYWNTEESEINNWYRIVMKSDTCDLCRFDFMCDSTIELSLIAPEKGPNDFTKTSSKSNTIIQNRSPKTSSLNIQKGSISNVAIFPNPASQDVNINIINFPDNSIKVNIYDITGKIVYSNAFNAPQNISIKINMSEFDDGVYNINIPELNFNYKLNFTFFLRGE